MQSKITYNVELVQKRKLEEYQIEFINKSLPILYALWNVEYKLSLGGTMYNLLFWWFEVNGEVGRRGNEKEITGQGLLS